MDNTNQIIREKRAVLKDIDDFLKKDNEPYNSIIRILYIAPNFNQIFKTMQTMELRELIVKRYYISPKKQDKKRYPILISLREYLFKDNDIVLDQDINPKKDRDESTSSDYHRFETYLNKLEEVGWITRPEKGYCRISNKFMFRPLQQWCSKIITQTTVDNSAAWWNSILFMPAITLEEINDDEIIEMKYLLHESSDNYHRINQLLNRIGIRKSAMFWEDFKKIFKGSKVTIFYYWLQLIVNIYGYNWITAYYHLLKKNKDGELEEKLEFNIKILEMLRYESYQDKLETNEIKKWQAKFKNLIDKAFINYIKIKYPKIDVDKLDKTLKDEQEKYDKQFFEMITKILLKWNSIEYSIQLSIPEFIRHQALEKHGMKKKSALDIDQAIRYLYNNHPFMERFFNTSIKETKAMRKNLDIKSINPKKIIEEIKNKIIKKETAIRKELKSSFFEKNDFLKGLSYNIRSLGYINKKELYIEIRTILNAFQPPELPSNTNELRVK